MQQDKIMGEVKVLGMRPETYRIGGRDIVLEPPSAARMFKVMELAMQIPNAWSRVKETVLETESNDDAVSGLLGLLTQTLEDAVPVLNHIISTNTQFKSGIIADFGLEFWRDDVSTSEITALVHWFVDAISIQGLLKNMMRLGAIVPATAKNIPAGPQSQQ